MSIQIIIDDSIPDGYIGIYQENVTNDTRQKAKKARERRRKMRKHQKRQGHRK